MEITRKPGYETWLLDKIKAWLTAQPRAEGVHVSDIVYPLKGYWRRVDPKPMSDAEAGFFIAGQGHHFVLETIIDADKKVSAADGGTFEWEGIFYSPDILTPDPVEIKTTRSRTSPGPKATTRGLLNEYATYLKQLGAYMAIRNSTKGDLIVFYLNTKEHPGSTRTVPSFQWYRVEITPEELAAIRHTCLVVKRDLLEAVATKDPSKLQPCPSWLCRSCVWADKCFGAPAKVVYPDPVESTEEDL